MLDVLDSVVPGASVGVLDDGWGVRADNSGRYESIDVEHLGARLSRRWHRPESWAQIRVAQMLGGFGNPVASRIARSAAVLDISGGDSFTDIYGEARLRKIAAPKEAAIRAGRPLVLLPQTYGPFSTVNGRRVAEGLVRSASLAYARDSASYERLLELAGTASNPSCLRCGVDVAFALTARRPREEIADHIDAIEGECIAGVNISGLLRGSAGHDQFGLVGDYVSTMANLVTGLVDAGTRVLLIPHVHIPGGEGESDIAAIDAVLALLPETVRSRVTVIPSELDAAELKWCIAQCSWFVGSRMHSTIAALSSGVPACGYAYSDKTLGVFETVGMGDHVVDARHFGGDEAVEAIFASFKAREPTGRQLAARVPAVVDQARGQLRDIVAEVETWRRDFGLLPSVGMRGDQIA